MLKLGKYGVYAFIGSAIGVTTNHLLFPGFPSVILGTIGATMVTNYFCEPLMDTIFEKEKSQEQNIEKEMNGLENNLNFFKKKNKM